MCILLFCLSLINCEKLAKWLCEPTQNKDIQNHIHLPCIRQQWLRLKQVADKAVRVIENECWLIVSWLVETSGTEHSPPVATVLVAASSGWSYVVLLVQYLQNLHDCFVPLHCQCCIIIIIIINTKDWTLWSVPSPRLQLLSPTFYRSSNWSSSLRSVVVGF